MKLIFAVKNYFKRIVNKLRYIIIKKNNNDYRWINVTNAIKHNSLEQMNEFYKDDNLLTNYIDKERIEFYEEVAGLTKKANINFSQDMAIVDIGCGTGHLLYYLKEEYGFQKATGLDYSPEAIKVAKKLFPYFDFYEFDIYKNWDNKYDIILCTEVLEHLLYPDLAFANILSMLNDGGSLVITVPNGRIDTFGGHINFWSPESWDVFIKTNAKEQHFETGTIQNNSINYAAIHKIKVG
ncbi:MAG: class I SAM-dependent methyltransferase [Chitinophagaceae bacterium]|nr:MAG: class I SAM-dependent methyltransferase [Chitinophagaceae bacterium]